MNGYSGGSAQAYTQTNSGLKYISSNTAPPVPTFPAYGSANAQLMSGQKYLYFSKDGNFMFGGSPVTSARRLVRRMIVAVKSGATPTLSGLYYQAGIDQNSSTDDLDTYFGSFNMTSGGLYLGHQRYNDYGGDSVYDYTYDCFPPLTLTSGSGYNNGSERFIAGAGGAELDPDLRHRAVSRLERESESAPTPARRARACFPRNPTGVVNSASYAPFTAGIAPGELLSSVRHESGAILPSSRRRERSPPPGSMASR